MEGIDGGVRGWEKKESERLNLEGGMLYQEKKCRPPPLSKFLFISWASHNIHFTGIEFTEVCNVIGADGALLTMYSIVCMY